MHRLLVVDDDSDIRGLLAEALALTTLLGGLLKD